MIVRVDHIAITAEDWASAVAQYALLFGRDPELRPAGRGQVGQVAWFTLRNTRIALLSGQRGGDGIAVLGLGVESGAGVPVGIGHGYECGYEQDGLGWEIDLGRSRGICVRLIERSQVGAEPAALIAEDQVEAVDHVVIRSAAPDRARELFGDALGIRLALDRELAGTRMLFFRVGGVTIEVIGDASLGELDAFYGLAYRVRDLARTHARLAAAGFALSEVRPGRKPGTEVFGLRSAICGVPTLFIRDPSRE